MDADVIMMLFREDYYDRENPAVQGRTGVAKMKFNSALNKFSEISGS